VRQPTHETHQKRIIMIDRDLNSLKIQVYQRYWRLVLLNDRSNRLTKNNHARVPCM